MNRHVKAECFRMVHSGIYFRIYVLACISYLAMVVLTDVSFSNDIFADATELSQSICILIAMIIGSVTAVTFGNIYFNRTYYYEIMDGTSTHKIIWSKLVVYFLAATAGVILPTVLIYTIVGIRNGVGQFENVWLVLLLYTVMVLHIIADAVLTMMIFRHILAGVLISWFWSEGAMVVYTFVSEFLALSESSRKNFQDVMDWFPVVQIMRIAQPEYPVRFVVSVIGSFLMGTGVLYIIVYKSFRIKNFK